MLNKKSKIILLFLVLLITFNGFLFLNLIKFNSTAEKIHETFIDFDNLRVSGPEINIITPENITYTEPMSGYYSGTWGFEDEPTGTISTSIKFINYDQGESNTKAEIIDEYLGHKKVMNCSVDSSVSYLQVYNNYTSPQTEGVIEFWWLTSDASKEGVVYFEEAWTDANVHILINNGNFQWFDGIYHTVASANPNTWYRHVVDFNCTTDKYTWEIYYDNGSLYGSDLNCDFRFTANNLNNFRISTWEATTWFMCFDAISYSWDPNYQIGENLNEGLLLSYDISFTPDWQGYFLDGQTNHTILGNTTFPFLSDGVHTIQVFGNNSLGTIYQSDIRYFTIDTTAPISMISFTPYNGTNEVNKSTTFTLTANDGVGSGVSVIRYKINDSSWIDYSAPFNLSSYDYGYYMIFYYSIDVAGHIESENALLIKLVEIPDEPDEPSEPTISGYIAPLLIASICIVITFTIKKRLKSKI